MKSSTLFELNETLTQLQATVIDLMHNRLPIIVGLFKSGMPAVEAVEDFDKTMKRFSDEIASTREMIRSIIGSS